MPTPSNADILAQAPALVATAKSRGRIRTGPLRPPVPTPPATGQFQGLALDARYPTLAVRSRYYGDGYRARTELGDRAACTMGERETVIRAALKSYATHAQERQLPCPEFDAIAVSAEGVGIWVTAVKAKEAA